MKNKFSNLSIFLFALGFMVAVMAFKSPHQLDVTDPGVYFKLNGTQKEFNQYPMAAINKLSNRFSLTIGASILNAKGKDIDGVSINLISNQNDFSAGKSYSIETTGVSGKNTLEIHNDIPNEDGHFWISSPGITVQEQLTVTITELTEQHVKGTFSGKVFLLPEASTQATITDGQFYVKFNQ
jgi:hypothetical protein